MTLLLRRAQQPKTYMKSPALFQVIFFLHCICSGLTWNASLAPGSADVFLQRTRLGWRPINTILCFGDLCELYLLYCQKDD